MSAGGSAVQTRAARQIRPWPAERRFYSLFSLAIFATVLLGFARTFYLRAWFPEWASLHAPAEPIFYVHGGLLTAWLMLLVLQAWLIGAVGYAVALAIGSQAFPHFPRRVLLTTPSVLGVAVLVLVVSTLASLLGVAYALRVDAGRALEA